jgi:membrane protease subunit (stomatin/prohibitin family)
VADVFGPGMYKLTTQTIPVLTNLKNWDKLFESPFKSDVYFFSTRLQLGRKWGTPQPVTIRDKDFGMVRLRAFGMYSYKLADPRSSSPRSAAPAPLHRRRARAAAAQPGGGHHERHPRRRRRALPRHGRQPAPAVRRCGGDAPTFERYGLTLDNFAVENISLPEELQKAIDARISMGMVGDLGKYTQFQVAQSVPLAAQNEGGLAGVGAGLAAGVGWGR